METLENLNVATTTSLKLSMSSTTELTNFLNRFKPISGSMLIEIEGEYLKAKTHTPERSVVKSSKIELSRVFNFEGTVDTPILFGVYSLEKLIRSFAHFDGPINRTAPQLGLVGRRAAPSSKKSFSMPNRAHGISEKYDT